jgi:hypothetical protein
MKDFRRLLITALLLVGMTGAVFSGTDYFLVVEQKPGGGFAQAVAMAIIPLLDDTGMLSITGVSNTVTLLLPPMPIGTPGLLAMANDVLLKPVPQASGKTPPQYGPAIAAALNLADEQAGALALVQPGNDARLVILTETTPKADEVSAPRNFARIDYISLNAAVGPELAALAGPGGVWELVEQPDPNADPPVRPFAEGFLEFVKTINGNYTAAKIGESGDGFTLGDRIHTVHNAVVIMGGANAAVSTKDSSPEEEAYQFGNYAAAVPGAAGEYTTTAEAQVIFAAAVAPLAFWFIPALVVVVLVLGTGLVVFLLNGPTPAVFNIRISKMDNREYRDAENPVYIAKVGWGSRKMGSGCTLRDVLSKIVSLNKKCNIQASAFEFLKDNKIVYDKEEKRWKITKDRGSRSPFPQVDVTLELAGIDSFTKPLPLQEKHGTHTYTIQFNRRNKK